MPVTFELPAQIELQLRGECADFDAVVKEAALVELYRQGQLSHHQLAVALELDRFGVNELLKRHHVTEDLLTGEDLGRQLAALRKFAKQ